MYIKKIDISKYIGDVILKNLKDWESCKLKYFIDARSFLGHNLQQLKHLRNTNRAWWTYAVAQVFPGMWFVQSVFHISI